MSSLITLLPANMEVVRRRKTKSLISPPPPFAFLFLQVGVCLLYGSRKLPPPPAPLNLPHHSLSTGALVDGWMGRWMRARRQIGRSVS